MSVTTTDRLFVPLNTEPYRSFQRGEKDIELRGENSRFNHDTVFPGRQVELRRGYSTSDSLWGTIGQVWVEPDLDTIIEKIDHRRIKPHSTPEEFIASASKMVGGYPAYILFEVTDITQQEQA